MNFPLSSLSIEILQAPLKRLAELRLFDNFETTEQRQYLSIIYHYLSGESEDLEELLGTLPSESIIFKLGSLRLQIMTGVIDEALVSLLREFSMESQPLSGEAAFVLGWIDFRSKDNQKAKESFRRAYELLSSVGVHQKAVKALLNVVVAESRINNKRRLIKDYEVVAAKAEAAGASEVQGICYQNISKEMHLLGAFDLALKYSHLALELQESADDSEHFYEALLHRCHVLIDLGRFKEAHSDFQRAKLSRHPRTVEAIKCIEVLLGEKKIVAVDSLEPAWVSKLHHAKVHLDKPTKTEMDFIDLIKSNGLSKDEIILRIYGTNTNWESAKNRFKVFLNRFRKKYPNLVIEDNGMFVLADEAVFSDQEAM